MNATQAVNVLKFLERKVYGEIDSEAAQAVRAVIAHLSEQVRVMTAGKVNDGGPAFPVSDPNWLEPGTVAESKRIAAGMPLRDYFAAKAMQGFLGGHVAHYGHEDHWRYADMAGDAYQVADAMLKARGEAA